MSLSETENETEDENEGALVGAHLCKSEQKKITLWRKRWRA